MELLYLGRNWKNAMLYVRECGKPARRQRQSSLVNNITTSVWAGIQGSHCLPSVIITDLGTFLWAAILVHSAVHAAERIRDICRIWRVDYTEQHLPAVIVIAGGYTCPCTNFKVSTYVALFINSITLHVVELQFLIPCG